MAVSPGLVFFDYGKGREGYWDALCFHNQTEDVLDCLEVLHPGWQPVLLCNWSSRHNGMGEGGLTTGTISGEGKMNLSYGGKQGDWRVTTLTQGNLLASTCDLRNSRPLVVLREVQVWGTLTPDTAFCCGAGTYQVMTPTLRKLERSCGAGANSWCSVDQSSTHNSLSASNVLDDNLNTYEHTAAAGDLNPWLRVDFGVARDVQVGNIWVRQDTYGFARSDLGG